MDWTKYDGWGGADTILNTKFDAWWKTHWKDLFGYELDKTEPKYPLSTIKPQLDGIKYSLLVYELRKENPSVGIGNSQKRLLPKSIQDAEIKGKRDPNFKPEQWSFNIARPSVGREIWKKIKESLENRNEC